MRTDGRSMVFNVVTFRTETPERNIFVILKRNYRWCNQSCCHNNSNTENYTHSSECIFRPESAEWSSTASLAYIVIALHTWSGWKYRPSRLHGIILIESIDKRTHYLLSQQHFIDSNGHWPPSLCLGLTSSGALLTTAYWKFLRTDPHQGSCYEWVDSPCNTSSSDLTSCGWVIATHPRLPNAHVYTVCLLQAPHREQLFFCCCERSALAFASV